jgi:MoxR-like ATPase
MVVSADLPDELAAKIDALVRSEPEPPVWPFTTKTVNAAALGAADRKRFDAYQTARVAYETASRDSTLRSRSAVVKMILTEYFARNGN